VTDIIGKITKVGDATLVEIADWVTVHEVLAATEADLSAPERVNAIGVSGG
jgi:acyl CoA:acetate/3-ketoacid CoA transferase beta subunit